MFGSSTCPSHSGPECPICGGSGWVTYASLEQLKSILKPVEQYIIPPDPELTDEEIATARARIAEQVKRNRQQAPTEADYYSITLEGQLIDQDGVLRRAGIGQPPTEVDAAVQAHTAPLQARIDRQFQRVIEGACLLREVLALLPKDDRASQELRGKILAWLEVK